MIRNQVSKAIWKQKITVKVKLKNFSFPTVL